MMTTRCPRCLTTFRLSESQRVAADGWVRCGRCDEMFLTEGETHSADIEIRTDAASAAQATDTSSPAPLELARTPAPTPARPLRPAAAASTALPPVAPVEPELGVETAVSSREGRSPPVESAAPRFVWEDDRLAPKPPATRPRAAWLGLMAVGVLGLALQAAHLWRQELAAHWPALQPVVSAWCQATGCSLQPLRQLQALRVESSELRQIEGTVYQLQVVVRNQAPHPVMWPSLDLSLTDTAAQTMARRTLSPAQLGAAPPALGAGQQVALQARLSTGERAVSGFTIDLYYP